MEAKILKYRDNIGSIEALFLQVMESIRIMKPGTPLSERRLSVKEIHSRIIALADDAIAIHRIRKWAYPKRVLEVYASRLRLRGYPIIRQGMYFLWEI